MKSTWVLERELLQEAWELERKARRIWIRKSIVSVLSFTFVNYLIFFSIYYSYQVILFIPWFYFMESGVCFFAAYLTGHSTKPVIIWNIFSHSAKPVANPSTSYNIGTHHALRYSLTGVILFLLSAITHFTWLDFYKIFIV